MTNRKNINAQYLARGFNVTTGVIRYADTEFDDVNEMW